MAQFGELAAAVEESTSAMAGVSVSDDQKMATNSGGEHRIFKVESLEGVILETNEKVIQQSEVLRDLMGIVKTDEAIPIKEVKAELLEIVFRYCEHFQDEDPYFAGDARDLKEPREGDFDIKFMNGIANKAFDVIIAANFLNVPRLIDAACLWMKWKLMPEPL